MLERDLGEKTLRDEVDLNDSELYVVAVEANISRYKSVMIPRLSNAKFLTCCKVGDDSFIDSARLRAS